MAENKPTVTLKDGTKITLDDPSQIAQYSNREDLESIMFGGDDEVADAGIADAGMTEDAGVQTVATVEVPKPDPVVPKPPPMVDGGTAITATIGAVAGAVSSAGAPAVMNIAKSFIKGKLKLKLKGNNSSGGESKPEDEKEEPTDCKTHQIKAGMKFASLSARLTALEGKPSSDSSLLGGGDNKLDDLEERLEKIEKLLKQKKGKRK